MVSQAPSIGWIHALCQQFYELQLDPVVGAGQASADDIGDVVVNGNPEQFWITLFGMSYEISQTDDGSRPLREVLAVYL